MALYITKHELDKALNQIDLNSFSTSTSKLQINSLIEDVRKRESDMLHQVFGANVTPEKFMQRLEKIQQTYTSLQKLNDSTLRWIVLQYEAKNKDESAREQIKFTNAIVEVWEQYTQQKVNPTIEEMILDVANATFSSALEKHPQTRTLGQRRVGALKSLRKEALEENLRDLMLQDLAEITQLRIRRWLKDKKLQVRDERITGGVQVNKNNLSVVTDLDWYSITKGLTGSEAEKRLSPEAINRKINAFKDAFKKMVGDIPNIDEILDYVFKKDPTIIFVGDNENAIIGLMGEIQALCYLSCLLGDEFKLSPQIIDWTATKTDKGIGKQYHADITLKEFGIQVKNSIKDVIDTVDFTNSTLDTFLWHLKEESVIDYEMYEDLMSLSEAYFFNVPYQPYVIDLTEFGDNSRILAVGEVDSNPDFDETRHKIIMLYQTFERILRLLVGQLLYIGVGDASKNEIGNVLFFVKGRALFASQILLDIYKTINEEISNFNMSLKYDSSFTIIDLLNEQGFEAYNHPRMSGFFDADVRSNILLKSSYNFESLYTKAINKK